MIDSEYALAVPAGRGGPLQRDVVFVVTLSLQNRETNVEQKCSIKIISSVTLNKHQYTRIKIIIIPSN